MAAARKREPDPPAQLQALEEALADGPLARGYALRGEERYFRERALAAIRARAEREGCEVCVHDAERGNPDFRLSALVGDLSGGGLFASRRLVVVRNGGELLKKAAGAPSTLTRAILTFLAAEEDRGCVVLSLASLRADHALAKAILAAGGSLLALRKLWDAPPPWSPDPRQVELVRWVLERARAAKLALSPDQAVYVAAATGNDLFALEDQIARLARLPQADLAAVVGWDGTTAPWAVAERMVAGELPRALGGIETLFRTGFQEKSGRRLLDGTALATMLISSLGREVRRSLHLASELERGRSDAEAARAAGVSGRAQAPALARARSRPSGRWRGMLEEVADLERAAKSSTGVDASDFALLAARWKRGGR